MLQNHFVINQEILSHQSLVQSVCDKAQELVNQTKDDTLNTYLESIKSLYDKIVTKSKVFFLSLFTINKFIRIATSLYL